MTVVVNYSLAESKEFGNYLFGIVSKNFFLSGICHGGACIFGICHAGACIFGICHAGACIFGICLLKDFHSSTFIYSC